MAVTETHTLSVISVFHALSDETRLGIVELLASGERCVCELTDSLDAAQSRLSFHLKVLKDAGLVTDRKEGRWVYYTLAASQLDEAVSFLSAVRPDTSRELTVKKIASRTIAKGSCC